MYKLSSTGWLNSVRKCCIECKTTSTAPQAYCDQPELVEEGSSQKQPLLQNINENTDDKNSLESQQSISELV